MKIVIISDTHGLEANLDIVLEREQPIDQLIHLGDVEEQEEYIELAADCPVDFVRGNCDYLSDLPSEVVINLEGYRALLTHGHYYYVSHGEDDLVDAARARKVQIVMYGHTHVPSITEYEDHLLVLNPGSLTFPRQFGHRPSYIVMEIEAGRIDAEIMYL